MDGREGMTLPGSASYYMLQRGIGSSVTQPGIHGQTGIRPLSACGYSYTIQSNISSTVSTYPVESSTATTVSPRIVGTGVLGTVVSGEPVKRKRGRPRKYGLDGTVALGLSSVSSAPTSSLIPQQKRGRGRPPGSGKKQQLASLDNVVKSMVLLDSLLDATTTSSSRLYQQGSTVRDGEWVVGSAGMGFTPHVIAISVGEDIASKIMSFSQHGPRAVCILSASGAVSTVILRQPSTSGGTVTYEGRFEILCLSGSYLRSENGGTRSRTGGLSVSLASPDGRVIGGGVAGLLIASSPVQVIVGSFIYGSRKGQPKLDKSGTSGVKEERGMDSSVGVLDKPGISGVIHYQNLGVVSQTGWPGSQSMNVMNSHRDIDIDLMRG